jgi:hypothetical protein
MLKGTGHFSFSIICRGAEIFSGPGMRESMDCKNFRYLIIDKRRNGDFDSDHVSGSSVSTVIPAGSVNAE